MGLAERFKEQIEKKDIFSKKGMTNNNVITLQEKQQKQYADNDELTTLKEDTINKINKTPYWKDYTSAEQMQMLEKYFDVKCKRLKYSQIDITKEEKTSFIKSILTLVNNK